jgi:hypothetical protein
MGLKTAINRAIHRLGYTLVRNATLAKLTERDAGGAQIRPGNDSGADQAVGPGNKACSLRLVHSENKAPPICTALAPKFDPAKKRSQMDRHIEEFQSKGITVIGTNSEIASTWRETEIFDRDVGNRHAAWDWAGNDIKPYSTDLRTAIPSESVREGLRQLFSADDFESFFRGVLGCPATVANCRVVKSPAHAGQGVGPQEFHRDGCPPGVIRGVLYLTDVDEDTGPFQYQDSTSTTQTVIGKTGDLLIFDAMRLLHRAMPPKMHERTAIDLVFMPRLPNQELTIMVAGMNHWPADPFFFEKPVERAKF